WPLGARGGNTAPSANGPARRRLGRPLLPAPLRLRALRSGGGPRPVRPRTAQARSAGPAIRLDPSDPRAGSRFPSHQPRRASRTGGLEPARRRLVRARRRRDPQAPPSAPRHLAGRRGPVDLARPRRRGRRARRTRATGRKGPGTPLRARRGVDRAGGGALLLVPDLDRMALAAERALRDRGGAPAAAPLA